MTVPQDPPELAPTPGVASADAWTGPAPEPAAAPPVVVVLVTHDPGWWFEETLASVADQTYAHTSVLVVDSASADADAVRARVASVLPTAHLRRLEHDHGFGAAANEALAAVQGATFLLLCHDDVRLAPDAVQVMVEEAYRSNAGVVGPKIVDWHRPERLLQVGMGADRYGQPAPFVERGDLDQSQHDAVRDSFYIPGAATLVRADLFQALQGFDPEITFHGDDLDLGWRARVAGARVVVAPAARVGHLEALGQRRPVDDRRRLQARHRLRVVRVADTFGTRLRTMPLGVPPHGGRAAPLGRLRTFPSRPRRRVGVDLEHPSRRFHSAPSPTARRGPTGARPRRAGLPVAAERSSLRLSAWATRSRRCVGGP